MGFWLWTILINHFSHQLGFHLSILVQTVSICYNLQTHDYCNCDRETLKYTSLYDRILRSNHKLKLVLNSIRLFSQMNCINTWIHWGQQASYFRHQRIPSCAYKELIRHLIEYIKAVNGQDLWSLELSFQLTLHPNNSSHLLFAF